MDEATKRALLGDILDRVGADGIGQIVLEQNNSITMGGTYNGPVYTSPCNKSRDKESKEFDESTKEKKTDVNTGEKLDDYYQPLKISKTCRDVLAKAIAEKTNLTVADYANVVETAYFDYFEDNGYDIEDNLLDLLYDKEIVVDMSKEPTASNWAQLLKDKLASLPFQPKLKVIKDVYSHQRAINIKDERIIKSIYENCTIEEDLLLFFNSFAEIAILQEKAKRNIEMIHRPKPEEKPVVLPDMVIEAIRKDNYLSGLFARAIIKIAQKTGKNEYKTKWSHVKTALEHNGLITEVNKSEFGRQINQICPEVDAVNCRQNIGNNELNIPNGKKYFELPETNSIRILCSTVAGEFQEIITELQRQSEVG